MPYDADKHHRRSIRLRDYDYTQDGAYFVTVCTQHRENLFGDITEGEMMLNTLGCIVDDCWRELENLYPYIVLEAYVIMPNHFHGIIIIDADDIGRGGSGKGGSRTAPTKRKPLGRLVGVFKTTSTKHINNVMHTPGEKRWQRNYYEHIVRTESSLNRIRQYIETNPARWTFDKYFADDSQ